VIAPGYRAVNRRSGQATLLKHIYRGGQTSPTTLALWEKEEKKGGDGGEEKEEEECLL